MLWCSNNWRCWADLASRCFQVDCIHQTTAFVTLITSCIKVSTFRIWACSFNEPVSQKLFAFFTVQLFNFVWENKPVCIQFVEYLLWNSWAKRKNLKITGFKKLIKKRKQITRFDGSCSFGQNNRNQYWTIHKHSCAPSSIWNRFVHMWDLLRVLLLRSWYHIRRCHICTKHSSLSYDNSVKTHQHSTSNQLCFLSEAHC